MYNKYKRVLLKLSGEALANKETKEIFDQLTEAQWIDACTTNGFEFNHWRIERTFNSMEDLYEYIKFIDVISDTFFDNED